MHVLNVYKLNVSCSAHMLYTCMSFMYLRMYVCMYVGRNGHVLRVLDQSNGNRGLLKDFVGSVVDVSFAHFTSNVLACVDQGGNVYVWQISENNNKLMYPTYMPIYQCMILLSWCTLCIFSVHLSVHTYLLQLVPHEGMFLPASGMYTCSFRFTNCEYSLVKHLQF